MEPIIPRHLAAAILCFIFPFAWGVSGDEPGTTILHDFEDGFRFSPQGKLSVSMPEAPAAATIPGVSGRFLQIRTDGQSALVSRISELNPPLVDMHRVVLRVNAPNASLKSPVEFEVQFHTTQNSRWWRRVRIDQPGWQQLDLPLEFFRTGSPETLPRWENVNRFALWFRNASTVQLDTIELVHGEESQEAYLSPAEIAREAFPDSDSVRTYERDGFVILTNDGRIEPDPILTALVAMRDACEQDFPFMPPARRHHVLVVFDTKENYQSFWLRFVAKFNSTITPPQGAGFTALGIATSSYSDKYGPVRPVFVHEACHVMLAERLRFGNKSAWLHEGLASRYQLMHLQQEIGPIFLRAVQQGQVKKFDPLFTGKPIPASSYWQAASLIEFFFDDETRAQQFRAMVEDVARTAINDLSQLAPKHFGMTLTELQDAWVQWAKRHYAE